MRARGAAVRLTIIALSLGASISAGAGTLKDKIEADTHALDAKLEAALAAKDAEAARIFVKANAWRDAGDLAQASKLYDELGARVPTFDPAFRRRCSVES